MSERLNLSKQPQDDKGQTVQKSNVMLEQNTNHEIECRDILGIHEINLIQSPSANTLNHTSSNDSPELKAIVNQSDSSISQFKQKKQHNSNSTTLKSTQKKTESKHTTLKSNHTESSPITSDVDQVINDALDEMDNTPISNDNEPQLHKDEFTQFNDEIEKKILIRGDANTDCVGKDTNVNITYQIYYIQNNIKHILAEKANINMIIDDDDRFTNTFHTVMDGMAIGEKALFKIINSCGIHVHNVYVDADELKHNDKHNKRVSPKGIDTYYEITVNTAQQMQNKDDMEDEECIQRSLMYKNNGNDLFKMERYYGAIKKYNKALDWINIDFDDKELNIQKNELMVSSYNNLTLIYTKLKDYSTSIKYASKVLGIDGNNIKALMRRGQSYLESDSWDLSKKDLKKALSLDKNKNEQRYLFIKRLLKTVNTKQQQYIDKQKKLYGGIFDGNQNKRKMKEYDALQKKYNELLLEQKEKETEIKDKDNTIKALEIKVMKQNKEYIKSMAMKAESKVCRKLRFESVTLKRSKKELQQKYNDLQLSHETTLLRLYNLEKKYDKQQKQFGYKAWSSKDVADWIVNLDKIRYKCYYNKLLCNAINERIDGECVAKLDKTDLHRMGITDFRDKYRIYNSIQELIKSDQDCEECVVCMDNDRVYCCVPCGHLCLCDKCKNLIDKVCPVCQTLCTSFLKIYS